MARALPLPLTVDTLNTLSCEHYCERIALEANFLSNLVQLIKEALPSFITRLAGINTSVEQKVLLRALDEVERAHKRALSKAPHLNYGLYLDTEVVVPAGFHGNYIAYVDVFITNLPQLEQKVTALLATLNRQLSSYLTNKEELISSRSREALFEEAKEARLALEDHLKHFFPGEDDRTRAPLSDILNRFEELQALTPKLDALRSIVKSVKLESVNAQLKECADLSKLLLDRIKEGSLTAVGPQAAKTLSQGLYESARTMESLSALYYRLHEFIQAYRWLVERIATW